MNARDACKRIKAAINRRTEITPYHVARAPDLHGKLHEVTITAEFTHGKRYDQPFLGTVHAQYLARLLQLQEVHFLGLRIPSSALAEHVRRAESEATA